jgi:outer membrane assembly lipoprotein YfiO
MRALCRRFCILAFLAVSCHPPQPVIDLTKLGPQELMDLGMKQLDAKQYPKAITTFQQITYDYATTRYAMEAQFYLAETYLRKKEYPQAQLEFEFLVTNYPSSRFAEEARFKTAQSYLKAVPRMALDQSGLKKAQDLIDLFREQYPESQFLSEIDAMEADIAARYARKEYDAAVLYARSGEYASARVYLEHILQTYPKASLIPDVKLQLFIAYDETGDKGKARQGYEDLVASASDPKVRKLAADRLARMKN